MWDEPVGVQGNHVSSSQRSLGDRSPTGRRTAPCRAPTPPKLPAIQVGGGELPTRPMYSPTLLNKEWGRGMAYEAGLFVLDRINDLGELAAASALPGTNPSMPAHPDATIPVAWAGWRLKEDFV
ncbi:MAG: hypothetical protein R3F11_29530 [Verrucomicrobiales bacterium]